LVFWSWKLNYYSYAYILWHIPSYVKNTFKLNLLSISTHYFLTYGPNKKCVSVAQVRSDGGFTLTDTEGSGGSWIFLRVCSPGLPIPCGYESFFLISGNSILPSGSVTRCGYAYPQEFSCFFSCSLIFAEMASSAILVEQAPARLKYSGILYWIV